MDKDLMKAFIMMRLFREITNSAMEWIRSLHQIFNKEGKLWFDPYGQGRIVAAEEES